MPAEEIPAEFVKRIRTISPTESTSSSSLSSELITRSNNFVRTTNRNAIDRSISDSSSNSVDLFDSSYLESSIQNDVNHGIMTYQPIKLPSEPTLEELLKQITGNGDLRLIRQIKLRVISSNISLQRLPYFMPILRCLNLEGSLLLSLRDLGCDLNTLVYLNVSRCGLRSLDGTNGLATLQELIADGNQIEDAGPCSNLPNVRKISLAGNKIQEFAGMMFLGLCANLKVLDLSNNAITSALGYREIIKENLPDLIYLDNLPYEEVSEVVKNDLLASEYKLGHNFTQEPLMSQRAPVRINQQSPFHVVTPANTDWNDSSRASEDIENRPTTAVRDVRIVIKNRTVQRPSTAESSSKFKHDVSVGEPLCGNILTRARKFRKLKTAWGESTSCSSISSSDSSLSNHKSSSTCAINENSGDQENETQKLLESSRLWRQRSQETREEFENE